VALLQSAHMKMDGHILHFKSEGRVLQSSIFQPVVRGPMVIF